MVKSCLVRWVILFCVDVEFKPTWDLLFSSFCCSWSYSALINIHPTPPLAPLVHMLSFLARCACYANTLAIQDLWDHEGHLVPLLFTENLWAGIKPHQCPALTFLPGRKGHPGSPFPKIKVWESCPLRLELLLLKTKMSMILQLYLDSYEMPNKSI